MNFSGISRETWLGKVLRAVLPVLPGDLQVPILQSGLQGARWIVSSGVHGYWLGSYEWDKRRLFEAITPKGGTVYDVGANVGFYTLLASRLVGPSGCVVAFEPLPRNLFFLQKHIRLNRATNVRLYATAVSDSPGLALFDASSDASMGSISDAGTLKVSTVALDELVHADRLPQPDLIKMDIEGGEARALRGAMGLLASSCPTILLATHGPAVHAECCDLLFAAGYEVRSLDGISALSETDELVAWRPRESGGPLGETGEAAHLRLVTPQRP